MTREQYGDYQYGSAVRTERKQLEVMPVRRPSAPYNGLRSMPVYEAQRMKQKRRARHMSFGYMLFLTAAAAFSVIILVNYISLRSEIQGDSKRISVLESRLNTMRQDNDEAYSRAGSSLDLEEIKRIAIQEYGMTYAGEGQIITYSDGGGDDYVRQLLPIPKASQ